MNILASAFIGLLSLTLTVGPLVLFIWSVFATLKVG